MRELTRIQAIEDELAFAQTLAGAMEQLGWEVVHRPAGEKEPLIVRRPSTYRIFLRYLHHSPQIHRIVIHVIFSGRGPENLSPEALRAANRLNDTYPSFPSTKMGISDLRQSSHLEQPWMSGSSPTFA